MVSSRSRTASVVAAAVSWVICGSLLLFLGDGAAAAAELGDEFALVGCGGAGGGVGGEFARDRRGGNRAGGCRLRRRRRARAGIGGVDLDVVEAAAPGAGAAVGDGGQDLAAEGRLEEVDVDAGSHGDGVAVDPGFAGFSAGRVAG